GRRVVVVGTHYGLAAPGPDQCLPALRAGGGVQGVDVAGTRNVDGRAACPGIGGYGGSPDDPACVLAVAVVPGGLVVQLPVPEDLTGRLAQGVEVPGLGAGEDPPARHGGAGAEAARRLVPGGRLLVERPDGPKAPGVGRRDRRGPTRRRPVAGREQVGRPV